MLLTSSIDLPLVNAAHPFSGATAATTYLAMFKEDGAALRYSTYLGGFATHSERHPHGRRREHLHRRHRLSVNFPTTAGAYQTQLRGPYDGYFTKFDPNGAVVFSTLLGGVGQDGITGLDVRNGSVYVTGFTSSTDFPIRNPLRATSPGPSSLFATKFTTGGELVYSTYLGDGLSASAGGSSVAVNSHGDAFVLFTQTTNLLPSKDGIQPSLRGSVDVYLLQLDGTGSTLKFATYFGGSGGDTPAGDRRQRRSCRRDRPHQLPRPARRHATQPRFAGGTTEGFVAAIQFTAPKRRAVQH